MQGDNRTETYTLAPSPHPQGFPVESAAVSRPMLPSPTVCVFKHTTEQMNANFDQLKGPRGTQTRSLLIS